LIDLTACFFDESISLNNNRIASTIVDFPISFGPSISVTPFENVTSREAMPRQLSSFRLSNLIDRLALITQTVK
jgi:hypothetical protein